MKIVYITHNPSNLDPAKDGELSFKVIHTEIKGDTVFITVEVFKNA